jgi:exonuclease III
MALHKKSEKLHSLEADILVVQECSKWSVEDKYRSDGWTSHWLGHNPNKGLAVMARMPWQVREGRTLRPKWSSRLLIDGPVPIELFAVWACVSTRPKARYIEQVHRLLEVMERTSLSPFTVVAGDFNSNSHWDEDFDDQSHSAAVERLRRLELQSAYHAFSRDPQGAERQPTYWFTKSRRKAFHIDYIFLSRHLLTKLASVSVGTCDDWLPLSDHAPVLVEIDL